MHPYEKGEFRFNEKGWAKCRICPAVAGRDKVWMNRCQTASHASTAKHQGNRKSWLLEKAEKALRLDKAPDPNATSQAAASLLSLAKSAKVECGALDVPDVPGTPTKSQVSQQMQFPDAGLLQWSPATKGHLKEFAFKQAELQGIPLDQRNHIAEVAQLPTQELLIITYTALLGMKAHGSFDTH